MLLEHFRRWRDSNNFFEINLKFLFFVGLWPDENLTGNQLLIYKIYEFSQHFLALSFLIVTGIGTYQIKDNIILCLTNIDKSIVAYNYVFKIIFFVNKRNDLRNLIDDIMDYNDTIKNKSRKDMHNILFSIVALNTVVVLAFFIFGIYTREMIIEAWMPFDVTKNFTNYLLSVQIISLMFGVPISYRGVGMQGIVCSLLIYLCDQLDGLKVDLRGLKCERRRENFVRERLKDIVKKHIRLMRYANKMEIMFKEYFLVQNLAVTMELCINGVMVIVVGLKQKSLFVNFVSYLILALLYAYIYCRLGDDLMEKSQQVSLAAYDIEWTSWPVDMKRTILLIIMAGQKPFQISAGGMAVINMQTYGTALYNGYSIFAVLNDAVN